MREPAVLLLPYLVRHALRTRSNTGVDAIERMAPKLPRKTLQHVIDEIDGATSVTKKWLEARDTLQAHLET